MRTEGVLVCGKEERGVSVLSVRSKRNAGRPSDARVPAGYDRATSLVERGIGGVSGSRLSHSGGFSADAPRSAPRTVPRLSPLVEFALAAAGIREAQTATPRHSGCATGMTWSSHLSYRTARVPLIGGALWCARFERSKGHFYFCLSVPNK
ncbi:hypothetical protein HPB50_005204 [Hyalomma asiaticum]|uniref:Uncharacterized protein n=1 Tax=Hyalomma asiaticum TaxID=266040 RepID=A0ACB7TFC0_HYAAI|nr:hypothetical protein HPB50_005204 [Hyalomma asiaticum]